MKIRGNTIGTPIKPEKNLVKATDLTEEEKAQARANIGAISLSDLPVYDGSYTELFDSPLPTEIATEAEMDALPIGAVFEYVGETTDKYENGTLYLVEESE